MLSTKLQPSHQQYRDRYPTLSAGLPAPPALPARSAGGITAANAREFLDAGASHVIVTSYVFRDGKLDWERLAELEAAVGGPSRLVLDLSCRKRRRAVAVSHSDAAIPAASAGAGSAAAASGSEGRAELGSSSSSSSEPEFEYEYVVVTDRWQKFTEVAVTPATIAALASHCGEFLVHGVDVEGLRQGIEVRQTDRQTDRQTNRQAGRQAAERLLAPPTQSRR